MKQDHVPEPTGDSGGGPIARCEPGARGADSVCATRPLAERGQTTVALAAVLAVAVMLGGLLATIAGAMVHRQRAQTAADAVALAAALDADAADNLVGWYFDREVSVVYSAGRASASSGPAVAEAWANVVRSDTQAMPALVAILARAEQLAGEQFASARVVGDRVELRSADAVQLRLLAGELGLCELGVSGSQADIAAFGLC